MDPTRWDAPFPAIVAALFVIVMLRANGTYWVGRLGTAGLRHTRLVSLLDSPVYLRATERIDRYGAPFITLSFLMIGVQTVTNLAAGAVSMQLRRYLPAVLLGSLAWALLYATLGTVGVDLIGDLWAYSPVLAIVLIAVVVVAIVGFVVVQRRRHLPSPTLAASSEAQPNDSNPA